MRPLVVILFLSFSIKVSAEAVKCPVENFVVFPRESIKFLKQFPQIFMAVKTSNTVGDEKPVLIKAGVPLGVPLVEGRSLAAGDVIKTKSGQTVELKFFMPTAQTITIGENSEVRIKELADSNCQSAFEILQGRITSEGTHAQIQEIKNCASEMSTQSSDIRPTGTKYSVDLSEAISEANGETIQTENYSVEKGSIQIKLRRASIKPKSVRLAKNGSFQLRAGQKAKVKINSKTKLADVQVVEP
jgi:hypothetical protein